MKLHYFEQKKADKDDIQLSMAIHQGYVPTNCLLGGMIVMAEVASGRDACSGCEGPREICKGRKKK